MRIAYLCNRYPAVSHSFVRREIAGVEASGHSVDRYTVRAPTTLLDEDDRAEAGRTTAILAAGATGLLSALTVAALRTPRRLAGAARLALQGAGWSPAALVRHMAYLGEAAWLVRRFRAHPVDHLHAHSLGSPADWAGRPTASPRTDPTSSTGPRPSISGARWPTRVWRSASPASGAVS